METRDFTPLEPVDKGFKLAPEITRKNKEGYDDPTAFNALANAAIDESRKAVVNAEEEQFRKLLFTIFDICDLSGFRLEGRIKLINKTTGKVYE